MHGASVSSYSKPSLVGINKAARAFLVLRSFYRCVSLQMYLITRRNGLIFPYSHPSIFAYITLTCGKRALKKRRAVFNPSKAGDVRLLTSAITQNPRVFITRRRIHSCFEFRIRTRDSIPRLNGARPIGSPAYGREKRNTLEAEAVAV